MSIEARKHLPVVLQVLARDCMRKYPAAQVYFIMFNDLVKSVFLNLYLATIIDKLDGVASQKSRLFKEDFVRFEQVRHLFRYLLMLSVMFACAGPRLGCSMTRKLWDTFRCPCCDHS